MGGRQREGWRGHRCHPWVLPAPPCQRGAVSTAPPPQQPPVRRSPEQVRKAGALPRPARVLLKQSKSWGLLHGTTASHLTRSWLGCGAAGLLMGLPQPSALQMRAASSIQLPGLLATAPQRPRTWSSTKPEQLKLPSTSRSLGGPGEGTGRSQAGLGLPKFPSSHAEPCRAARAAGLSPVGSGLVVGGGGGGLVVVGAGSETRREATGRGSGGAAGGLGGGVMLTTADEGGVAAAVSRLPAAHARPSAAHRLHPWLLVAVHLKVAGDSEGATAQLLADAGRGSLLHVPAHGAPASLRVHLQLPGAAAAATGEPQFGGCGESRAIRGFAPLPAAPRWFSSRVWLRAAVRLSTTAAAGAAGSMGQEGNGACSGCAGETEP